MHKGKLKSWFGDKGFGFIESPKLKDDTFIHISTLNDMSRKPRIGDVIYFDIEQQTNGKARAINCRIDGVSTKALKRKKHHGYKQIPEPGNRAVLFLTILGICVFVYYRLGLNTPNIPTQQYKTPINQDLPARAVPKAKPVYTPKATTTPKSTSIPTATIIPQANFKCDGRQHCSQMSSYDEAKFFIKNCPNTKMDGDKDGVPCENYTRF